MNVVRAFVRLVCFEIKQVVHDAVASAEPVAAMEVSGEAGDLQSLVTAVPLDEAYHFVRPAPLVEQPAHPKACLKTQCYLRLHER